MAHVMRVGIATLDIINRVEKSAEDREVRALAQAQRMGGSTAIVLAQLYAFLQQIAFALSLGVSRPSQFRVEMCNMKPVSSLAGQHSQSRLRC